jgi:hypothetical protein
MATIWRRGGVLTLGTLLALSAPTAALADPSGPPRTVRTRPAGTPPPHSAVRTAALYADVPRRERTAAGPTAVRVGLLHLGGTEQLM